jgi:hypothetical protein
MAYLKNSNLWESGPVNRLEVMMHYLRFSKTGMNQRVMK